MGVEIGINGLSSTVFAQYEAFVSNAAESKKAGKLDLASLVGLFSVTSADNENRVSNAASSEEPYSVPELEEEEETSDIRVTCEDLERIIAKLQAETDEKQIKRLQQELEDKKSQLNQQLGKKIDKIKQSVEKAKNAEKKARRRRIFGIFSAILSLIAAAVVTVFTGGVAAGFAIAGAALAVANCVLDLTGGTEKICEGISKSLAKHHPEWGSTKCDAVAQAIFGGIMFGASLICLGGGFLGSAASGAKAASDVAKVISLVSKIVSGTTSVASGGIGISSSVASKQAADAAAKVKEQQAYLLLIQKALEENSEDLEKILSGYGDVFAQMMSMINENTDTANQITQNIAVMA